MDEDYIEKPRKWDAGGIRRFMMFVGPISSIFDYATFALLWYVFKANSPTHQNLFQTGWFVESLLTQTIIIHIIRTNKIPFLQSQPSWPLMMMSLIIMSTGIAIPFTHLGSYLGFTPLPLLYWPLLTVTLLSYVGLTQLVKMWLLRRKWI